MAVFTKGDKQRLDWSLLHNGSITKYYREHYLTQAVEWLLEQGYKVIDVNCSELSTTPDILKAVGVGLEFPDYFQGNSLDAFDDHLYDVQIPNRSGAAIVFHRYDLIVKAERRKAWQIVNILDHHSRSNLMCGLRLITLIQTANPKLELDQVGAQDVKWNQHELLDSQRGK